MRSCLSEASSSNDYDNITAGLRAQDVFAPFFVSFLSVMKEMKIFCILSKEKPMPLLKIIKFVGYLPLCAEKVLYLHSNFEN